MVDAQIVDLAVVGGALTREIHAEVGAVGAQRRQHRDDGIKHHKYRVFQYLFVHIVCVCTLSATKVLIFLESNATILQKKTRAEAEILGSPVSAQSLCLSGRTDSTDFTESFFLEKKHADALSRRSPHDSLANHYLCNL